MDERYGGGKERVGSTTANGRTTANGTPITRRERIRQGTVEEIKAVAREQMRAEGTAALSLRAIARAMGLTAPALYRYFPGRDDLITALIVDAYSGMAEALEHAAVGRPEADVAERLLAVATAYRGWARDHATEYMLILGNPIPGYVAPAEVTTPAARRGLLPLLALLTEAERAGRLHGGGDTGGPLPPGAQPSLPEVGGPEGADAPEAVLRASIALWSQLHGFVSLELYGHFTDIVSDLDTLFELEMRALLARIGISAASA